MKLSSSVALAKANHTANNPARHINAPRTSHETTIADIVRTLGGIDGSTESVTELIEPFLNDCMKIVQDLKDSVETQNSAGVRHAANDLKGTVSEFTTRAALKSASQMDYDLHMKAWNLERAQDAYDEAQEKVVQFRPVLSTLLQGRAS